MKTFLQFFFLLIFVTSVPAYAKNNEDHENWETVSLDTIGLSIEFPGKPEQKEVNRVDHSATSLTFKKGDTTFKLIHSLQLTPVAENEHEQFLLGAIEIFTSTYKAQIKSQANFSLEDSKGKDLKLIMSDKNHLFYRIFFKGDRLITMLVMKPKKFPNSKDVSQFFDSLKWVQIPQDNQKTDQTETTPEEKTEDTDN